MPKKPKIVIPPARFENLFKNFQPEDTASLINTGPHIEDNTSSISDPQPVQVKTEQAPASKPDMDQSSRLVLPKPVVPTQKNEINTADERKRQQYAFAISVATAALLLLGQLLTIIFNSSPTANVISTITLSIGFLLAAASAWLCLRGKNNIGIGLILLGFSIIYVSRIFVAKGYSIPIGILYIVLMSATAYFTLLHNWVGRVILFSLLVALSTVILDQYTRDIPESSASQVTILIALILAAIFLLAVVLQFKKFSLRTKLIIVFLFLTTLPLIILGLQSNLTLRATLEDQIKAEILDSSLTISDRFQKFVDSQHSANNSLAQLPEIVDYMALPPIQRPGSQSEFAAGEKLKNINISGPPQILSYRLVDINGNTVLDSNSIDSAANLAEEDFFEYVILNHTSYTSGLTFTSQADLQVIYFASPILSNSIDLIGVLVVTYDVKFLQLIENNILNNLPPTALEQYSFLIDDTNFFILSHSSRVDFNYRTFLNQDDARLTTLRNQGLINSENINSLANPQPEMVDTLSNMKNTAAFRVPSPLNDGNLTEASAIRIANSDWILVTARPISAISEIIQNQNRTTLITSLILIILAALLAVVVSNIFITPLIQLNQVVENFSAGDFSQRVIIKSKDEIGILAYTFNRMSSEIQELVSGLEQRLVERATELKTRTMELEQISLRSGERAAESKTRTMELEQITLRSEERAAELKTRTMELKQTTLQSEERATELKTRSMELEQITLRSEELASELKTRSMELEMITLLSDDLATKLKTRNMDIEQITQRSDELASELKTRNMDLEQITRQSEKRAKEMKTIGEIARTISTEQDLESLLPLIAQTVSERFGYYHIGIFLLNKEGNFAILRAANSPGGKKMLNGQHKLEVGRAGIVGNVTFTGKPHIASDTGTDAIFFNNPHLPQTRSEMTLPLTAHGTIIGALDVQSTVPNGFDDSDLTALSLLADQLAIAIDNIRLTDEIQNALMESKSFFSDYVADSWQRKSTSEIPGYHQPPVGDPLITAKKAGEIGKLFNEEKESLAIPIRLRSQTIGTLNIGLNDESRNLTPDEVNIVQAFADRLGLALDPANLPEETSSSLVREKFGTDITTKTPGTNDPQEMIKSAVDDLKRTLGAIRVDVLPKKNKLPPNK